VCPALNDFYHIVACPVQQTVHTVYPAAPKAGKLAFQRLGFADSVERISKNLFL
jgi:hypothetical protein